MSKHANSSDDSFENESKEEFDKVLFMAVEEKESKIKHDSSDDENKNECEVEVNLEVELVVALEEVYAERRSHKKTSKKLTQAKEMVIDLKVQVEECQKMIEDLETQLCTKVEYCSELEAMVAALTQELDEKNQKIETYHKLERGTTKLNELIENQRTPNIKFNLGFTEGETSKAPRLDQNKVPHIKFHLGFKKTETPQVPKVEVKEATPNTSRVEERKPMDGGRTQYTRQTNVPRNERYNHDEDFTYMSHQRRRRFPTPQTSWKNPHPRFNYYFHGYCFKCNAYGHKIV